MRYTPKNFCDLCHHSEFRFMFYLLVVTRYRSWCWLLTSENMRCTFSKDVIRQREYPGECYQWRRTTNLRVLFFHKFTLGKCKNLSALRFGIEIFAFLFITLFCLFSWMQIPFRLNSHTQNIRSEIFIWLPPTHYYSVQALLYFKISCSAHKICFAIQTFSSICVLGSSSPPRLVGC